MPNEQIPVNLPQGAVLNFSATTSMYGDNPLQPTAAMALLRFVTAALAVARPSTLEARLAMIPNSGRNRHSLSCSVTWMSLALLLFALVPVATRAQENPAVSADAGSASSTPAGSGDPIASSPPATRPALLRGSGGRSVGRSGFVGGAAAQEPPKLGEGPTCSLDATIYDVRLPADKIGQLDLDALTKAAATPADFEKALVEMGTARPLYHTDQTVRLAADTIAIGTQTPFITNSRTDANGHVINSVQYQQTGAIFDMAGKSIAADNIDFDLKIQLSTISASSTEIVPNVKSPLFRTATMSHKGAVGPKMPFVVLSADAASVDENGKAVVYIARIILGAAR